jgi:hypothetical protein
MSPLFRPSGTQDVTEQRLKCVARKSFRRFGSHAIHAIVKITHLMQPNNFCHETICGSPILYCIVFPSATGVLYFFQPQYALPLRCSFIKLPAEAIAKMLEL